MTFRVSSGDLTYELVPDWERLPTGFSHPDVADVCTDSEDNVYLLCRAQRPVLVYDRHGAFLDSWGEGEFSLRAHGMFMTGADELLVVDDGGGSVGRYSVDGKLLTQFGPKNLVSDTGYVMNQPESVQYGGPPFNRPTNATTTVGGHVLVSDGYGNCRIHRFDALGNLLGSFGEPGSGPGQFRIPHSVWSHSDGRIFVADRQNDRIQIFAADGTWLTEWLDVQRPQDIFIDANGLVYVAELGWWPGDVSSRRGSLTEVERSRLSIYDLDGNVLLRWTDPDPSRPGGFFAAHGIWVDSDGSIYLAEVARTIADFKGLTVPNAHTLQKFVRC